MHSNIEPTQQQQDEAALWHVRHAGGSMSALRDREFDAWLAASPANRRAYDQMQALWAQLEEPAARLSRQRLARNLWQPLTGWMRSLSPGRLVAGFAVPALIAAALWLVDPELVQNLTADVVSGREVVSRVDLPDGSVVRLGADSALEMDFAQGRRGVELLRGQAFFEVVHRDGHPFQVRTGDAVVRVVGTRFNVDRLAQGTVVTVQQGAVRVTTSPVEDGVLIGPGQQVAVDRGQLHVVQGPEAMRALSWLEGRLSIQNQTLAALLTKLEAYQGGHIVALGSVAERRISGSFPVGDVGGSLVTIAAAVNARLVHLSPWLTVLY
jgi:transmembrane sensor